MRTTILFVAVAIAALLPTRAFGQENVGSVQQPAAPISLPSVAEQRCEALRQRPDLMPIRCEPITGPESLAGCQIITAAHNNNCITLRFMKLPGEK